MQVASDWFERTSFSDNITLLTEPHVSPFIRCNIWHVRGRDRDLLIDSGLGICSLHAAARDLFEHDLLAVVSHTHFDHTGGLAEFDNIAVHKDEAHLLESPGFGTLDAADIPDVMMKALNDSGYELDPIFIDALPHEDYNLSDFEIQPVKPSQLLEAGDVLDTGDRHFEVLHLPGHSPGSIGLWEKATSTLFSGDAIYDGPLIDFLPESDIVAYIDTMKRLRELPVDVVHGGHDPSFGRDRCLEIIDDFLTRHDSF